MGTVPIFQIEPTTLHRTEITPVPYVLVFNIGSSTNKLSLFSVERDTVNSKAVWESSQDLKGRDRETVLNEQLADLDQRVPLKDVSMVGHRVVHGGRKFRQSTLITEEVVAEIERLCELAPLHNPAGLAGIRLARRRLPDCPQIAVFDTAAYAELPPERAIYALPYSWYEEHGIQRYGFHGINHEYVAQRAAAILGTANLRAISCHLGNGCSVTGLIDNRSVYTSMGYTPLEGLVMGTRSGSVDPGILVYALNSGLVSQKDLDDVLNKKSGLLGISGKSNDMRTLLELADQGDERSRLAIDIFVYRLGCEIGAAVATMNGADALIFTGGIGENATAIRKQICDRLSFLGLALDEETNRSTRHDGIVSSPASRIKVLVINAQENMAIANQCLQVMASQTRPHSI